MNGKTEGNFSRAFTKLSEFLNADAEPSLRRTAIIQAFEYTFEAGWKLLRARVIVEGEVPAGPRDCVAKALRLGIIDADQEESWLDMLRDRNNSVPTYNEDLALQMEQRIRVRYCAVLSSLGCGSDERLQR